MQALAVANPDLYLNLADMIQGTKTPEQVAQATQDQFAQLAKAQGVTGFYPRRAWAGRDVRLRRPPHAQKGNPMTAHPTDRRPAGRGRGRRPAQPTADGRRQDHPLWFLDPALCVILVVFFFVPTIFNFVYAFTNWSSFKSAIGFVGVRQLRRRCSPTARLLSDLRITLIYAVLVAIFQNVFGLAPRPAAGAGHPRQPVRPGRVLHPGVMSRARGRLHLPGAAQARRRR